MALLAFMCHVLGDDYLYSIPVSRMRLGKDALEAISSLGLHILLNDKNGEDYEDYCRSITKMMAILGLEN
jgi:hypothetical protein